MPELSFEVYCGICGEPCCQYTTVHGSRVDVECPKCSEKIKELENEVDKLNDRINMLEDNIDMLEQEKNEP